MASMRQDGERDSNLGSDPKLHRLVQILGVQFLDADVDAALARIRLGGLMVVPSGPGLATLDQPGQYREALQAADFAIVDSAYLALLWFMRTGHRLHRVSGLAFIRRFLDEPTARAAGSTFLVCPSQQDARASISFLKGSGWQIREEDCYVAPHYGPNVEDPELLSILRTRRPRYVMLCVGGGTQEPLGHYLKREIGYNPGILCTGAALAFLTGQQARIPVWVDASGLGWLARSLSEPRRFVPRYLGAIGLSKLVFASGPSLPPLVPSR